MMRGKAVALAGACAAAMLAAGTAQATTLANGGFESHLDGWTVSAGDEIYVTAVAPVGLLDFAPRDGDFIAVLVANGADQPVTLSQAFHLDTTQRLRGWAGFQAFDYLPYDDYGFVRILGDASHTLFSSSVSAVGDFGVQDWSAFSVVLGPGDYVLQAGVSNAIDDQNQSLLVVDNFRLTAVPEPAGWTLMIGGFFGLGALMRRRRAALA